MASIAEPPLSLARREDTQLLRQPPARRRVRRLHETHVQLLRQQPQQLLGQNTGSNMEPLVIMSPDGSFNSWQNRFEEPYQTNQRLQLHYGDPRDQQQQQHHQQHHLQHPQGSAAVNSYKVMRHYMELLKQHTANAAQSQPRNCGAVLSSSNAAAARGVASNSSSVTNRPSRSRSSSISAKAAGGDEQWPMLLQHTKAVMHELQYQPQQASAIIYIIAKLRLPAPAGLLQELFQQLQHQQLSQLQAMALTNVLWAAAVLSSVTSTPASAANTSTTTTSNSSSSSSSSSTISATHTADVSSFHLPPGWLGSFFDVTGPGLTAFNQHQLTSLVWSVGQLQQRPPAAWVQGLLAALSPALAALSATQLTNTIWGLAQIGYKPNKPWMKSWFQAAEQKLPVCTADHLACLAASLALLRVDAPHSSWMVAFRRRVQQLLVQHKQQQKKVVGRRQQQQQQLGQELLIHPRHVATILCGLAKRRSTQPPHWVRLLLQTQLAQQQQCGPQDLAATVWSLPLLLSPTAAEWAQAPANAALLHAAAAATLPLLPQCGASELVQLAVGFARLRYPPGARWVKVHELALAGRHLQLSEENKARLRKALSKLWLDR